MNLDSPGSDGSNGASNLGVLPVSSLADTFSSSDDELEDDVVSVRGASSDAGCGVIEDDSDELDVECENCGF